MSTTPGTTTSPEPFHAGEMTLQRQVGARERLAGIGPRVIRDHMPDMHRELFQRLPTLWVGSLDADGQPWASVLVGSPGFVQAPDPWTLHIDARPLPGDPLAQHLAVGAPLGLLGLEPKTRRRNRMNGAVTALADGSATVHVDQSFGNCPQYIQAREPRRVHPPEHAPHRVRVGGAILPPAARHLVRRSDTLFIASAAPGARAHAGALGVDVSHRGGKPGFVRVDDDDQATWLTLPDFRGNQFFNTLGNLAKRPQAGLLFTDPDSGDMLQLAGDTWIVWDGPELTRFAGAERLLRMRVRQHRWTQGAVPLRWSAPAYAPQLAGTGAWDA